MQEIEKCVKHGVLRQYITKKGQKMQKVEVTRNNG